jgi:vacuolar-type H+-ATPase subunit H
MMRKGQRGRKRRLKTASTSPISRVKILSNGRDSHLLLINIPAFFVNVIENRINAPIEAIEIAKFEDPPDSKILTCQFNTLSQFSTLQANLTTDQKKLYYKCIKKLDSYYLSIPRELVLKYHLQKGDYVLRKFDDYLKAKSASFSILLKESPGWSELNIDDQYQSLFKLRVQLFEVFAKKGITDATKSLSTVEIYLELNPFQVKSVKSRIDNTLHRMRWAEEIKINQGELFSTINLIEKLTNLQIYEEIRKSEENAREEARKRQEEARKREEEARKKEDEEIIKLEDQYEEKLFQFIEREKERATVEAFARFANPSACPQIKQILEWTIKDVQAFHKITVNRETRVMTMKKQIP